MKVIKFNQEKELYSEKKVLNSARKAGASRDLAVRSVQKLEKDLYDGISTLEISEKLKKILEEEDRKISLKFNLKKAIKKLGPTGFPFEKYVAEIFKNQGFKTQTNTFLKGKCCSYEIDFTAQKNDIFYIGECKYRNLRLGKVHTKDALANYARFLDIKKSSKEKSILVTNNKFTSKTIKYSRCVGVELLGWKYPTKKGLEKLIEEQKLYPVTILPSLKKSQLEFLIEKEKMMAKDILRSKLDLPKSLIEEARILLE